MSVSPTKYPSNIVHNMEDPVYQEALATFGCEWLSGFLSASLGACFAAQPFAERPIETTGMVYEHEELDSISVAVNAWDSGKESGSRSRKRARSRPPEGVAKSSKNSKGRQYRVCKEILRRGFDEHAYDGSARGVCPLRDAVARKEIKGHEYEMHEQTEAAIQRVLISATLQGADRPGRKCSKCRRPYKSWLTRDGRSLSHRQFRLQTTDKKYTQVIWCPLLDSEVELDLLFAEQIQRKRDRWRAANDRRKNKWRM
ncbi:hypothetical protein FOZ60_003895 [Perkinsus olseni]|uniref:Uncharacterized protein n=1 Tax=Perkinsus olseni TaxID=32597 RepID=A0A7J6NUA8_PEROL|nr:hypothetical protein FOZ60_003895 [Perkinsus olseni]